MSHTHTSALWLTPCMSLPAPRKWCRCPPPPPSLQHRRFLRHRHDMHFRPSQPKRCPALLMGMTGVPGIFGGNDSDAGMMGISGVLLLYTAMIVPVQVPPARSLTEPRCAQCLAIALSMPGLFRADFTPHLHTHTHTCLRFARLHRQTHTGMQTQTHRQHAHTGTHEHARARAHTHTHTQSI